MIALETLEKLDFFQGFPPDYLKPLAAVAEMVSVPADEVLFREGEKSAHLCRDLGQSGPRDVDARQRSDADPDRGAWKIAGLDSHLDATADDSSRSRIGTVSAD